MKKRSEKEINEYVAAAIAAQRKDAEEIIEEAGRNPDKLLGDAYQADSSSVATSFTSGASSQSFSPVSRAVPEYSGVERFFSGVRETFSNVGKAVSGFFGKIFGGGEEVNDFSNNGYSIGNYNDREIRNNEYDLERPSRDVVNKVLEEIANNPNQAVGIELDAKQSNGNYVSQNWIFIPTQGGNVNMYPMSSGGYRNAFEEYSTGGQFTVSNYQKDRSDTKSWWQILDNGEEVAFSFDLTNERVKNDPNAERSYNRFHMTPDFTGGCNSPANDCGKEFERDMVNLMKANGGKVMYNIMRSEDPESPYLNSNRSDAKKLDDSQLKGLEHYSGHNHDLRAPQHYYASNDQSQGNGRA